jgi:hypothetical protein
VRKLLTAICSVAMRRRPFVLAAPQTLPHVMHTVLTDRGSQVFDCTPLSAADAALPPDDEPAGWRVHAFEYACEQGTPAVHPRPDPRHPRTEHTRPGRHR